MNFPDRLLLPLRFDAAALSHDADRLEGRAWDPHFNTDNYEGDWSGVALRSSGGPVSLYPDPHQPGGFHDTPLLGRCPAVVSALAKLRCPVTSVRFLRLGPGARIREHRDYGLNLAGGEARLHIAVRSNDLVDFVLDSRPIAMRPGECWYLDVNKPHRVANNGSEPRVHLVVDCVFDQWLCELMKSALGE